MVSENRCREMNFLIFVSIFLYQTYYNHGHVVPKTYTYNGTDALEIRENSGTPVRIIVPKSDNQTLREIIYYHLIERPYDQHKESKSEDSDEPEMDFDETRRPFTNGHGYQFLDSLEDSKKPTPEKDSIESDDSSSESEGVDEFLSLFGPEENSIEESSKEHQQPISSSTIVVPTVDKKHGNLQTSSKPDEKELTTPKEIQGTQTESVPASPQQMKNLRNRLFKQQRQRYEKELESHRFKRTVTEQKTPETENIDSDSSSSESDWIDVLLSLFGLGDSSSSENSKEISEKEEKKSSSTTAMPAVTEKHENLEAQGSQDEEKETAQKVTQETQTEPVLTSPDQIKDLENQQIKQKREVYGEHLPSHIVHRMKRALKQMKTPENEHIDSDSSSSESDWIDVLLSLFGLGDSSSSENSKEISEKEDEKSNSIPAMPAVTEKHENLEAQGSQDEEKETAQKVTQGTQTEPVLTSPDQMKDTGNQQIREHTEDFGKHLPSHIVHRMKRTLRQTQATEKELIDSDSSSSEKDWIDEFLSLFGPELNTILDNSIETSEEEEPLQQIITSTTAAPAVIEKHNNLAALKSQHGQQRTQSEMKNYRNQLFKEQRRRYARKFRSHRVKRDITQADIPSPPTLPPLDFDFNQYVPFDIRKRMTQHPTSKPDQKDDTMKDLISNRLSRMFGVDPEPEITKESDYDEAKEPAYPAPRTYGVNLKNGQGYVWNGLWSDKPITYQFGDTEPEENSETTKSSDASDEIIKDLTDLFNEIENMKVDDDNDDDSNDNDDDDDSTPEDNKSPSDEDDSASGNNNLDDDINAVDDPGVVVKPGTEEENYSQDEGDITNSGKDDDDDEQTENHNEDNVNDESNDTKNTEPSEDDGSYKPSGDDGSYKPSGDDGSYKPSKYEYDVNNNEENPTKKPTEIPKEEQNPPERDESSTENEENSSASKDDEVDLSDIEIIKHKNSNQKIHMKPRGHPSISKKLPRIDIRVNINDSHKIARFKSKSEIPNAPKSVEAATSHKKPAHIKKNAEKKSDPKKGYKGKEITLDKYDTSNNNDYDHLEAKYRVNDKMEGKRIDTLVEIMKDEEFWKWLAEWTSTYMDVLSKYIRKLAKEEIDSQLKEWESKHQEKIKPNKEELKNLDNNSSNDEPNPSKEKKQMENKNKEGCREEKQKHKELKPLRDTDDEDAIIIGGEKFPLTHNSNLDEIDEVTQYLKKRKNKDSKNDKNKPTPSTKDQQTTPTPVLEIKKNHDANKTSTVASNKTDELVKKNKTSDVQAAVIYGNAVDSESVTNIFVFYPNGDLKQTLHSIPHRDHIKPTKDEDKPHIKDTTNKKPVHEKLDDKTATTKTTDINITTPKPEENKKPAVDQKTTEATTNQTKKESIVNNTTKNEPSKDKPEKSSESKENLQTTTETTSKASETKPSENKKQVNDVNNEKEPVTEKAKAQDKNERDEKVHDETKTDSESTKTDNESESEPNKGNEGKNKDASKTEKDSKEKENSSTVKPDVDINDTGSKIDKLNTNKDDNDSKKEAVDAKKKETEITTEGRDAKKGGSETEKEEPVTKKNEADSKTDKADEKKEGSDAKNEESSKKEATDSKKDDLNQGESSSKNDESDSKKDQQVSTEAPKEQSTTETPSSDKQDEKKILRDK